MSQHTPGPWMVLMKRHQCGTTSYVVLPHVHTLVAVDPRMYWPDEYIPQQRGAA